ncbi:MAG: hypothetical protein U1F43_36645 [Myxococcota bacterium]
MRNDFDQHAGDRQRERHHQHGDGARVLHEVAAVGELAERPPEARDEALVAGIDDAVAVEVDAFDRQVSEQRRARERAQPGDRRQHRDLTQPVAARHDADALTEDRRPVAEQQEQPRQPEQPEPARVRQERQERRERQERQHVEPEQDAHAHAPPRRLDLGLVLGRARQERHAAERQLGREQREEHGVAHGLVAMRHEARQDGQRQDRAHVEAIEQRCGARRERPRRAGPRLRRRARA